MAFCNRISYFSGVNSQFPMALHIMGFLTSTDGGALTSVMMAKTYGTSPVVLRRVLAKLQRAGLVQTRRGVGGGSVLGRDPASITLRDVYEAVADEASVLPSYSGNCSGPVAPVLAGYVNELFADAEQALLERLGEVTVAEMDLAVRSRIVSALQCKA
ncbi:MAG: Rrf2 family transcriptional regulator [Pseudomonadota bacterium]